MREALASYIEATYHLSDPKVVALRRTLLTGDGIAQTPYIESTPSYEGKRRYQDLDLPAGVGAFLTALADRSEDLLFNPPYEHQAQALELTTRADAAGSGIVVTTGTGSGKTESFLLPVLARLAEEALDRPKQFETRAVRALLLYPMNALVNDQLGRLRNLFGSGAVRKAFKDAGGRPAKFGRYTGRTLYPGFRNSKRDQQRLKTLDYYLTIEDAARGGSEKDQKLVETLREKGRWPGKLTEGVTVPTIAGLSEEDARSALVQLWLWQALKKHGIKLQHTPINVEGARGSSGVRPWTGKFSRKFTTLLEERGLKQWLKGDFAKIVTPVLRDVFSPGATGDFYVLGSKVALDMDPDTQWIRCERCTTVSPRNALVGIRIARACGKRRLYRGGAGDVRHGRCSC
nr:DEAD/DEAH box helicase [Sphingomonas yantingensis]